jgi:hypothetical protein
MREVGCLKAHSDGAQKKLIGEAYVLIPRPSLRIGRMYSQCFTYTHKPEEHGDIAPETLDVDEVEQLAIGYAENYIWGVQCSTYLAEKDPLILKQCVLHEANTSSIRRLWLAGWLVNEIKRVHVKTKCPDFKDYLTRTMLLDQVTPEET